MAARGATQAELAKAEAAAEHKAAKAVVVMVVVTVA